MEPASLRAPRREGNMCRAKGPGYRRCPYHSHPLVMAVQSAKLSVQRLERRLDSLDGSAAPMSKITRGVERLVAAVTRLGEREQLAVTGLEAGRGALVPPRSSEADSINADDINSMSWDEIGQMFGRYGDDPEALEKLQLLVEEREERENGDIWQKGDLPPIGEGDEISNPTLRPTRKLTPHEVAREEYDHYVCAQYAKCESELSFLLNNEGRAKGIDTFSLFSGPVSRVKKYGTEELQAWFAINGRHTLGSFRHAMYGWGSDAKAALNARLEGFENVAHVI